MSRLAEAVEELGAGLWPITRDRPSIKPFASCGGTHSAIAAVLELRERIGGDLDAIDAIARYAAQRSRWGRC